MLVDLHRCLHVQLAPDGLLGKGLHGIHRTILGKHLAIRVRHLFGKGRHELGVGGRDLGLDGLHHGKVCGRGTDGCSNALGDCQLFGRALPTVVGEDLFNLCGDRHELGVGGRNLGLDGLRRRKVCGGGTDGCSNALGDCQFFGRGLPTVVGEASFDFCGDRQELGMGSLDMVVGGLHQG